MRLGEVSLRSVPDRGSKSPTVWHQLLHGRLPVARSSLGDSTQYRLSYDKGTSLPRGRLRRQLPSYCSRSPMFNYYAAELVHQARAVQDYPMASKIVEDPLPQVVQNEVRSSLCTAGPLHQLATFPQTYTPPPSGSGTEPVHPQQGPRQSRRGDRPGSSRSSLKTL